MKGNKTSHFITLVAVVIFAVSALLIEHQSARPSVDLPSLIWLWLLVLISLILICAAAGLAVNGRLAGILIDDRYRMSLSRLQWVAWFLVLFSSYFVGAIWNVGFGADLPAMDPNLFALIGISTGSAVVSSLVVDTKMAQQPSAAGTNDTTLAGRMDQNASPKDAAWQDLYLGEEEANRYNVDVTRLQKLVTTGLLVIVYVSMLWSAFPEAASAYDAFAMPVVGSNFVILLGASHAAYLASKATSKKPAAAASGPGGLAASPPPPASPLPPSGSPPPPASPPP